MFWVLFIYAILTGGVVYAGLNVSEFLFFSKAIQIHSLLGFVIGLLLVFRTNSAYDRWWEGRKQWGALVNSTRNAALKFNAALGSDAVTKKFYATAISNYGYALKEHLRNGVIMEELDDSNEMPLAVISNRRHIPNAIANYINKKNIELYKSEVITGEQLIILDQETNEFTDILGACERIKNTPIPFSYNLFIKKFIFVYTLTLPFGLAQDYHYWTIPISTFILYVFGSLELLAEEIEEPFGTDTSDLPTDNLVIIIKDNVNEILCEPLD
jgi:putative membrane protein